MALSPESEDYIQELCLLSTAGVTCIIGLVIHFFIVGVSVLDWWKGRPLTTADLLITAIGASRFIFQFASLFHLFWENFWDNDSAAYYLAIDVILSSSTYCNLWLSVLLSVFYSLKISNFHNVLFLYLMKIISQRALGLIIMSVLLSIGFSLVEVMESFEDIPKNSTLEDDVWIDEFIQFRMFMFFLWNSLPFLFYVISSFAILGSLCHHLLRMKRDSNVTSHLDAYYKTIKYTVFLFFCFILYLTVSAFGLYFFDFLSFEAFYLVWNCFPMLHSIYLIYMAGRLRGYFFKIVHGVAKFFFFGQGSESRAGVQIQIISR